MITKKTYFYFKNIFSSWCIITFPQNFCKCNKSIYAPMWHSTHTSFINNVNILTNQQHIYFTGRNSHTSRVYLEATAIIPWWMLMIASTWSTTVHYIYWISRHILTCNFYWQIFSINKNLIKKVFNNASMCADDNAFLIIDIKHKNVVMH